MIIELMVVGLFTGVISGFFGVGGGLILVPILLYFGFDIKEAIGISVVSMMFSSIFGSYLNFKKGTLHLKSAIFFGFGGFIGGLGSGFIVENLSAKTLTIILLFAVVFAIYKFFMSPIKSGKKEIENRGLFFLIGAVVGLLATSVGIGGSLILIPIMVGFLHFELKKAISASLFFVVFSSISAFLSLSYFGHIDYFHGVIIGISSLLGVFFGISVSQKTNPTRHKTLILILNIITLGLILNKIV